MIFKIGITPPKKRGMYAVVEGTMKGEFLVYMGTNALNYVFHSLPNNIRREVPINSFVDGLKDKIIDFVEVLPKKVYKVVELQHKSINTNNGLCTTKKDYQPDQRSMGGTEDSYNKEQRENCNRSSLD